MERPEYYTEKHARFLERLRDSGRTNMFGARPYLMKAFKDLSQDQAYKVLTYWMHSFGKGK